MRLNQPVVIRSVAALVKSVANAPLAVACAAALAGCVASSEHAERAHLSGEVQQRTGHAIRVEASRTNELPPRVELTDGLEEDEAVAIALWNNAAFQKNLSKLDLARGDLAQEVKKVERSRTLGGELLLPLERADGATSFSPDFGESISSLLPAMTPAELVRVGEMQVDADGQVAAAQVELDAAKVALERAQNLVASRAGTQRNADEAHARVQLAEAALRTARERRALLGAPLFEAVRTNVLWVRVSVYVSDLNRSTAPRPQE